MGESKAKVDRDRVDLIDLSDTWNLYVRIRDDISMNPKPPPEKIAAFTPRSGTGSSSSFGGGNQSSESQALPQFDGDSFIDQRDGKRYKYEIAPNGRVWMSENLNYSRGGTIGYCFKTGEEKETLGIPGENLPGCDSPYGRNYTYETASDGKPSADKARGICPKGWHIPNATEWSEFGSVTRVIAGNYYPDGEVWRERSTTNGNGFYWISNAVKPSGLAFTVMYVNTGGSGLTVKTEPDKYGNLALTIDVFSVRCIMDEDTQPTCGGQPFNLATQLCSGGQIRGRCGGQPFDPATDFCNNGNIYPLCNGEPYTPVLQECKNDVVIGNPCRDIPAYTDPFTFNAGDCVKTTCSTGRLQLENSDASITVELTGEKCSGTNVISGGFKAFCDYNPGTVYIKAIEGSTTRFKTGCW
jgi:uncharacterized protein (TIGR02145 family)